MHICKKLLILVLNLGRKVDFYHLYKNFRSADTDLELIPVEEFYDKAPETISKPEITKDNSHEQRLACLNYELHERKRYL